MDYHFKMLRTESSHIHNVAELDAYRECGFEEYEFMASLSERTCEVCGRLDGKRFKLSDKQYGVNFPPLHPNCRCTTIAFDPDDNLDDLKAGEMEYEEWKREFVTERAGTPEKLSTTGENVLTNNPGSGIIKADEKLSELGAFKQKARSDKRMSDEYYQAVKEKFSHGTDTAKAVFNKYVPKNSVADTEYIYNAHYNPSNKMVYLNYASDLMNDRGACAS